MSWSRIATSSLASATLTVWLSTPPGAARRSPPDTLEPVPLATA
jgi:hypothetical protein